MKMKIVIAGASGLIGAALSRALGEQGHAVHPLVRRAARSKAEISWDPAAGRLEPGELEGADAIINLAGENIAAGRWTAARRERILQSRVAATRTLVAAVKQMRRAPAVFLSASAVGYYGDRGDEVLTESSALGHGFLPGVCLAWETHAQGAQSAKGIRIVLLRFGTVLARDGGALAKMLPVFRSGVGGRLGSGEQWMSWIAIEDVVGVVQHALADTRCKGPLNVTAPEPVTNAQFTKALAHALRRPAVLPVPAAALRLLFGGMADEALLASTRAVPQRLQELGYTFRQPTLEGALEWELRSKR